MAGTDLSARIMARNLTQVHGEILSATVSPGQNWEITTESAVIKGIILVNNPGYLVQDWEDFVRGSGVITSVTSIAEAPSIVMMTDGRETEKQLYFPPDLHHQYHESPIKK